MSFESFDVLIATCTMFPSGAEDEPILADALGAAGLRSGLAAWDDPAVDWASARLVLVRSTWNYEHQRAAFLAWAERVEGLTQLWNPAAVLRWNTHKGYLVELAARGAPVVPTRLIRMGECVGLAALCAAAGWSDVVIKPAVGAGARGAHLARAVPGDAAAAARAQAHLDELLGSRDVLVQPFQPRVDGHGERSLVFIDGELTHAIRKPNAFGPEGQAGPKPPVPVEPIEEAAARAILALAPARLLYARVDLVRDAGGQPLLMELEATEPRLFLPHAPHATARLVAAITRAISSSSAP